MADKKKQHLANDPGQHQGKGKKGKQGHGGSGESSPTSPGGAAVGANKENQSP